MPAPPTQQGRMPSWREAHDTQYDGSRWRRISWGKPIFVNTEEMVGTGSSSLRKKQSVTIKEKKIKIWKQ
jgi:hypothetical protein